MLYNLIFEGAPVRAINLLNLDVTSDLPPLVFNQYAIQRCLKHFKKLKLKVNGAKLDLETVMLG